MHGLRRAGEIGTVVLIALFLAAPLWPRKVLRQGVKVTVEVAIGLDLQAAQSALDAGRYDEAIKLYQQFLTDFPEAKEAPLAMAKIGEAYFKKGDVAKAAEIFSQVLAKYPKTAGAVEAAWGLAMIAYGKGDCVTATQTLAPFRDLAEGKRWEQINLLLAECAQTSGQIMPALQYLADEYLRGADRELKTQAKTKAEALVKKMSEAELTAAIAQFPNAFPGDFALLEAITRAVAAGNYERAAEQAAKFKASYPKSEYLAAFEALQTQIEKRTKVAANRIGLLLPLSGQLAGVGEQALRGAMLAGSIFNPSRAILPAEFIVRDVGADQVPLEQIITELVNEAQVMALVGPLPRSLAERAAVKAEELGVPIVLLSPGEDLPKRGKMVYQNYLTKSDQVEALVNYAIMDKKLGRFGILYPNSDYGKEFMTLFVAAVKAKGGNVNISVPYETNQTDFKAAIAALRAASIQALFIPDSTWSRVATIAPQLRFYQLTGVKVLGVSGWHSDQLLARIQPEDLEGAVFTEGLAAESTRPAFNDFANRFRSEFSLEPGLMEAQAYETMDLILRLIQTNQIKDRDKMRLYLDQVRDFPAASGPITTDAYGKLDKPIYLYQIAGGKFQLISQPP